MGQRETVEGGVDEGGVGSGADAPVDPADEGADEDEEEEGAAPCDEEPPLDPVCAVPESPAFEEDAEQSLLVPEANACDCDRRSEVENAADFSHPAGTACLRQ
jgi:hypothetical protein